MGANRGRSLSLQLGLRRLQLEPSGSLRVVSVLVILVFIGCLGNGVARDVRSGQLTVSAIQLYSVKAAEVAPSARASLLGGNGSQGVAILQNNRTAVAFGSCAGLGALLGRTLTDCSNAGTRITYQGDRNAPLRRQQLVRLAVNRGSPFSVTMPTRHLLLTEQDGTTLAPIQALLPLQNLPGGSIPSDASLTVGRPNNVEANDAFYNTVYGVAPAADVTNEDQDYVAAESTDRFAGYFELALLLALTLGVSGFVIATADRAIERRPNIAALEVVGVPHRTIVVSQAVQLVVPLALGAVVALVPGLLTEQAYLVAGGQNPAWAWRSIATDVVFALIALLVAAAGATLAVGRRPDVSMLRRD